MYDRKISQMSVYLLRKKNWPTLQLPLLMGLLYLAEREFLSRHGDTMTGDDYVGFQFGPALNQTFVMAHVGDLQVEWRTYLQDYGYNLIGIRRGQEECELDELSKADTDVLDHIWAEYSHFGEKGLRRHMQENFAEWHMPPPRRLSFEIPVLDVLKAVGHNDEDAKAIAEHIREVQEVDKIWDRVGKK